MSPSARERSQQQRVCYLCGGERIVDEVPRVRDNASLKVLACAGCGLVFLSSFDHITSGFYEASGMHGGHRDLGEWLRETAEDDQRRFEFCRSFISEKRVLDFGCGNGGFLLRARSAARTVAGVDPEAVLVSHFREHGIPFAQKLSELDGVFDVITIFHVLEHMPDPRRTLVELAARLVEGGQIVIEVPNANDALLRLYDCEAFRRFTYWSCHLFLFTAQTLGMLVRQAGGSPMYIKHIQRYPLSNHLYWLAQGQPGGHRAWAFLDSRGLMEHYQAQLASVGLTDTLLAGVAFPRS